MTEKPPADPPFRAEHIGSLVRPPALLQARREFAEGKIDAAGLRTVEDAAVRSVVQMQEEAGLKVVTDGEFRRTTYSDAFTEPVLQGVRVQATDDEGWKPSGEHGARTARDIPKVVDKIRWLDSPNAENFRYLKSVTKVTPKVTLPGPAYIHYRAGRVNISTDAYPDLDDFWTDIVHAYHQELKALGEAGCTYVQIDETSLVKLGDPRARKLLADRGDDWAELLPTYIDAVNAVIAGAPAGMRIGVHICRSQNPSWQADTGYDPIAEKLFNDMKTGFYFLEYDNERAGTFEPLKYVPRGKKVVLGIVASRVPQLETADYIRRRIEDATHYIDLDQLALSPQCGFATSLEIPEGISAEMEQAKLARIVEVANEVWEG